MHEFKDFMFHHMFLMFHRGAPLGVPPEGPPGPLLAVHCSHVSLQVFHVSPDVFHVSPGGIGGGAPGIPRGSTVPGVPLMPELRVFMLHPMFLMFHRGAPLGMPWGSPVGSWCHVWSSCMSSGFSCFTACFSCFTGGHLWACPRKGLLDPFSQFTVLMCHRRFFMFHLVFFMFHLMVFMCSSAP